MNGNNETREIMTCKKCGTTIEGDMKFCPNCGAPLAEKKTSPKKKGHKLLIVLLIVVGLYIVGSVDWGDNETSSQKEKDTVEEEMSTRSNSDKQSDEPSQIATSAGSNAPNSPVWSEYEIDNQYVEWAKYLWEEEYLYAEATDEVQQLVHDGLVGEVWTNGVYSFTFDDDMVTITQDGIESKHEYRIIAVCGSSLMKDGYNVFDTIININGEYLYLGRKVMYLEDGQPYLMLCGVASDGLTDGIALDTYDNFVENDMEDYAVESSEFMQKVWAEELTQTNMNIEKLIRDPNTYCDGSMYRFTGYIDAIRRDEYVSWATLKVENSLIVINYPGWIEAVQGDQITVYGYVAGIGEYSNSVQGTVQTANIDVFYYTVGACFTYCEFTDEQWDFILGEWHSNDDDKYIESTVTLTKDTINGRPYTIKKLGIGTGDVGLTFGSNANLQCGQYLLLDIEEEAANGETIDATWSFYFDGRTSHSTFGSKSKTYYYDKLYIVDFYR